MSTGVEAFDTTIQKSEIWIKEIQNRMKLPDRHKSVRVLRAVLHSLRDRLTIDEGAHLSAQLPILIRGLYYEGWRPSEVPVKYRTREELLLLISDELDNDRTIDPEKAVNAVFAAIKAQISPGEIERIGELLPPDIQKMWAYSE